MNIIGIILIVIVVLILVGIVFKLAKFALKLLSLVFLFVVIIWAGFFIYDQSTQIELDRLYVIEYNDSYKAYVLGGDNYTFVNLEDDETKELLAEYDKVYLVSYETVKRMCLENTSVGDCVQNISLDSFWTQVIIE